MTEFRDRGDEIHMQPLSFKEYVDAVQPDNLSLALNEYMLHGGMPVTLSYETAEEKEEYLKHLFSMTYHKDVEERNKIRNEFNLSTLTTVMASTVGSLTNPNKIANTFNTELKSNIGKDTIAQYLNYLEEAFVLRKVNRFDIKGRKHIGATYKYYFADPGLRNARRDFLHRDDGHIMENILYNELILRGYSVQVGVVNIFTNDK
ncbi:ATP-binding protein, partial [uncultured Dubosiella sp.]